MENNPMFDFKAFQTFFAWNNSLIIIFLALFYGGLLVVTNIKSRMLITTKVSKAQKLMTIQAVCICGEMCAAPLLHIFMLFWKFPVIIEILAHFSWICLHGDTPVIYFILNKTLRNSVTQMVSSTLKFPKNYIKNYFAKKFASSVVP
uniref:G-protein coupled receptors family 1 profile domain-containing protein n=1 Tax=Panagrolaimus superbus TaxID=310955 RepID=A0A914YQ64_9BILA